MDLRQLRHFLAVVEHGSILRAADVIHLTQPALSRSIQTLEAELEIRLLERGRRGIEPTPHGLLLARHARRLLAQADQVHVELRGLRAHESIRLAVGVGTHLGGGEALSHVIAALLEKLPHLTVTILDGNAEELVAALQRGELDVALCAWPAEGVPSDLVFEEMATSDLAVVCRSAHPLARRRRVTLPELAERRWALAERPRALGQVLRLTFAAVGLPQPEPVVRSTSLSFLRALLLETDLVSLIPAGYFAADLTSRRLVRVRTDVPPATTRVGVLRRNDETAMTVVVATFLEGLRATLRPHGRRREATGVSRATEEGQPRGATERARRRSGATPHKRATEQRSR